MENPRTYCVSTVENNIPYMIVPNQTNILCNAKNIQENERKIYLGRGFVLDDFGDNISNLNYTFAELTGLYWVWKNTKDYVSGITHYRRFWNQSQIKNLKFDEKTLYVFTKINVNSSLYDHFITEHGQFGMEVLETVVNKNKLLFTKKHFDALKTIDFIHCCNMFFCTRPILEKICEILFEVLFEMYKESFLKICQLNNYQKRLLGFVAERLTTVIYCHLNDFFDENIKLEEVNLTTVKLVNKAKI